MPSGEAKGKGIGVKQPEWKHHELEWLLLLVTRRSLRDIAEERKVRVSVAFTMRRRLVEKLRETLGEDA